jgi:Dynamin family
MSNPNSTLISSPRSTLLRSPMGTLVKNPTATFIMPPASTHISGLMERFFYWRYELSLELESIRKWLDRQQLRSPAVDDKIALLLHKLAEEKITIAIVAEFSRGKSELINAIFFADFGRRLLPSGAGTTTMCPTELMWDDQYTPGLRLLPIETRETTFSLYDYKKSPAAWTVFPFDINLPDTISHACRHLAETIQVSVETAESYGLYDPNAEDQPQIKNGMIAVPRWRHAVFNFPHPLLKQGLVVLDTPGLNAIGTEPELTINMIPNAHAVLFILGADTGVTKSDRAIWNEHIVGSGLADKHCIVALNKIDGMWDELKSAVAIDAEIASQVAKTSEILNIPPSRIFPISAQKGLVAKINQNHALLDKSRLMALEKALSEELPLTHSGLMQADIKKDVAELFMRIQGALDSRRENVIDERKKLESLRGKNREMTELSVIESRNVREAFERVSDRFNKLNSVINRQGRELMNALDVATVREQAEAARQKMLACTFSKGVVETMQDYFKAEKHHLEQARDLTEEIHTLAESIYQRFIEEHGFKQTVPPPLPFDGHFREIERLQAKLNQRFGNTLRIITQAKTTYTEKFFIALANQVIMMHEFAIDETRAWMNAILMPLENEVRVRRMWLTRREEDIGRAQGASQILEQGITALDSEERVAIRQLGELSDLRGKFGATMNREDLKVDQVTQNNQG